MKKSIASNLIYNILFQFVLMVLPLITLPYISRVLGAEGVGIYSYTFSIAQYFIIAGTIGLTMYGSRQIAYARDKNTMSKSFWSILLLRVVTTGVSTLLYVVYFWNSSTYQDIYMIQTITIIAAMLDISWLYIGLEDFKKIVTRNLVVKIIGVILIFILVKNKNDLYLYVLINVLMIFLGNLIMWVYLPSTVNKVKITFKDVTFHLIPAIQLFVPQIAIQIYVVLDKSMLGMLSNIEEVGLFSQTEQLVKATLALITAFGTVMMPRMSNIFSNGDKSTMNRYLNTSLRGVAFVAVPMSIGVTAISKEFIPWFLGSDYESAIYLMMILSPILFFIAMSNVMGMQYLMPSNRTKVFSISVITGAIVNVIINFIMIPKFHALGACISTVIAEFTVTGIQYYSLRKEIKIKLYIQSMVKFIIAAIAMLIVVRILGDFMGVGVTTTVLQTVLGIVVYLLVTKLLREQTNEMMISTITNWMHKKRF